MSTTVDTATELRPFQIEISDEQLDDLRRRFPELEVTTDADKAVNWPGVEAVVVATRMVAADSPSQKLTRLMSTMSPRSGSPSACASPSRSACAVAMSQSPDSSTTRNAPRW